MTALEKLENKNNEGKFICVGLDTDIKKIPVHLKDSPNNIFEFNKQIIENTIDNAAAYKLNLAFYECYGIEGIRQLEKTLEIIPSDILTIGDAKRGDIGNTSNMYAKSIFENFAFDSITLNPYMGYDSISPFFDYSDKLNFVLTLTSNKGASDFEKVKLENGERLYQLIIEKIKMWNENNNCGLVYGATNTKELEDDIDLFGQLPVLVPGVGAQGGNLKEVIKIFSRRDKMRLLVNVSRGIIYKESTENFANAAVEELIKLNTIVNEALNK